MSTYLFNESFKNLRKLKFLIFVSFLCWIHSSDDQAHRCENDQCSGSSENIESPYEKIGENADACPTLPDIDLLSIGKDENIAKLYVLIENINSVFQNLSGIEDVIKSHQTNDPEFNEIMNSVLIKDVPAEKKEKYVQGFISMCFKEFNKKNSFTNECFMERFVDILNFLKLKFDETMDEKNEESKLNFIDDLFRIESFVTKIVPGKENASASLFEYGNESFFDFTNEKIILNESKVYKIFEPLISTESIVYECKILHAPTFIFLNSAKSTNFVVTNFEFNEDLGYREVDFFGHKYKLLGFIQYDENFNFSANFFMREKKDETEENKTNETEEVEKNETEEEEKSISCVNPATDRDDQNIFNERSSIFFMKKIK